MRQASASSPGRGSVGGNETHRDRSRTDVKMPPVDRERPVWVDRLLERTLRRARGRRQGRRNRDLLAEVGGGAVSPSGREERVPNRSRYSAPATLASCGRGYRNRGSSTKSHTSCRPREGQGSRRSSEKVPRSRPCCRSPQGSSVARPDAIVRRCTDRDRPVRRPSDRGGRRARGRGGRSGRRATAGLRPGGRGSSRP